MFCKVISHQQTICWVFSSAKFAKYELLLNFELKSNSVNCHLTDSCFVTEDITEELLIKYSCHYVWITHRECIVYVSLVTLSRLRFFNRNLIAMIKLLTSEYNTSTINTKIWKNDLKSMSNEKK